MSTLIAVTYPEEQRASEVLEALRRLQTEYLVDLEDAVVVVRDANGKLRLHQAMNLTAAGAVNGAFWGFLIGMIFTLPFPFMAPVAWLGISAVTTGVGAATGAIGGHFSDYGIDDTFVRQVSATMQGNGSALFILMRSATLDKLLAELSKFGGTVLRTSLSQAAEDQLRQALQATPSPVK